MILSEIIHIGEHLIHFLLWRSVLGPLVSTPHQVAQPKVAANRSKKFNTVRIWLAWRVFPLLQIGECWDSTLINSLVPE